MGDCVEVRVCNPGQGFPAQKRDELFAMFVRGQTESTTPGTGLGLAICRAIIKAHDGVIGAEDRLEGGACVRFTLPKGVPPVLEEEAV